MSRQSHSTRLAFWPHIQDRKIASYRMRCAAIVQGLNTLGYDASEVTQPQDADFLVLSKRYDEHSIRAALDWRAAHGTKVVLDLCDNHFYYRSENEVAIKRAALLRQALESVDFVTTSSAYLAEQLQATVRPKHAIEVIDDVIEPPDYPQGWARCTEPKAEWALRGLSKRLSAQSSESLFRLVWFGNSGGGFVNGGMEDVLGLRSVLETLRQSYPISLTIVSNSRAMFDRLCAGWALPVFYEEWHPHTISRVLSLHGISLIPIQKTPFTMAKTANRVVTAMTHGLLVLADQIPSYTAYESHVLFDDFAGHLKTIFSNVDRARQRAAQGQASIHVEPHNQGVFHAWAQAFERFSNSSSVGQWG